MNWVLSEGLVSSGSVQQRRLERIDPALLASCVYPEMSLQTLEFSAQWMAWLFLHDDHIQRGLVNGRGAEMIALEHRLLAVLADGTMDPNAPALVTSLVSYLDAVRRAGGERWYPFFAQDVSQYIQSNIWELQQLMSGQTPDVETYRKMRRLGGATYTCFDFIFMDNMEGYDASVHYHAYARTLSEMATDHVSWVNDLLGYYKEIEEGSTANMVLVLMAHEGRTLQEALYTTATLCNQIMEAFLELEQKLYALPGMKHGALQRQIEGFRVWMRGHIAWMNRTGRFQVRSAPTSDGYLAIDIPIIAPPDLPVRMSVH
ncbi:MAG: hypothetical protein AAFV53_21425 [Myxococcota bacterium]